MQEEILTTFKVYSQKQRMVELIRDGQTAEIRFAVLWDGKIQYSSRAELPSGYMQIPPQNSTQFPEEISLPARADNYGDTSALYNEIDSFIDKYVDLDENFRAVCTHYILLTHVFQKFHSIPYIRVVGGAGTGKTTLTSAMGLLSYRGFEVSGSITPAVLFRTIDRFGLTLIVDESDFADERDSAELIKILNNGYAKNKSVSRIETIDGSRMPVSYRVFSPKILNGRSRFGNDALESRCITGSMHESIRRAISYQLPQEYNEEARQLRNKLLKYRFDKYFEVKPSNVDWDKPQYHSFPPRLRQIMIPLLSISPNDEARRALISYFADLCEVIKFTKLNSLEGRILSAIQTKLFMVTIKTGDLSISGICEYINEDNKVRYGWVTPKKAGYVIRDLGLKTRRSTGGNYVVVPDEELLKKLFIEYGLE